MHARERWRTIENHEREDAAAEQEIGGPCTAFGVAWADDDEPVAQLCERRRGESATGVDPRDPPTGAEHTCGDLPQQRGLAGAQCSDDFGNAATGQPTAQRTIERADAGRPRLTGLPPARDDSFELRAERG